MGWGVVGHEGVGWVMKEWGGVSHAEVGWVGYAVVGWGDFYNGSQWGFMIFPLSQI